MKLVRQSLHAVPRSEATVAEHLCRFIDLGGQKCCVCGAWKPPTRPAPNPTTELPIAAALKPDNTSPAPENRMRDIYHLTLTYGDSPVDALKAIRELSRPR